MNRYRKSLAALVVGLATAGALLPTDAPPWLLAVGVIAQTLAVWAVRNDQPDQPAANRLFGPRRNPPGP